jgi:hypothetical protein
MGSNGSNRVIRPHSIYEQDNFRYLKYGQVESIQDENGMGRIKVRVKGAQTVGGDDGLTTEELPYAFPLLPKHLSAIPKIGEIVWVFVLSKTKQNVDRIYIGPIISQLDKLNLDSGYPNALRPFSFAQLGAAKPVTSIKTNDTIIPELVGVFPNPEDISIQGRFNTDITQKNNEIVIRAGKFESANTNEFKIAFNAKTQAFIQIKNEVTISKPTDETVTKGTVTNIVANKINLLTHKDGAPRFNLTNQQNLISDEELANILEQAHQIPFGDVLLEYLRLLKNAIFSHVHNGNGNPATDLTASGNVQAIAALKSKAEDLENRMLSKNIRIN